MAAEGAICGLPISRRLPSNKLTAAGKIAIVPDVRCPATGTPRKGSPRYQNEHLQITHPDGGTALASRSKDQSSSSPKDEAASAAGTVL